MLHAVDVVLHTYIRYIRTYIMVHCSYTYSFSPLENKQFTYILGVFAFVKQH